MITEDYCSYEVSKLLKEKGFDEATRAYFYGESEGFQNIGKQYNHRHPISENWTYTEKWTARPTHQMAMKWLREKYNIFIQIEVFDASTISGEHTSVFDYIVYDPYDHCKDLNDEDYDYPTYEQAVEAALKYALENLIEL